MDWDKREAETSKAFDAFCVYRDLGPARSLDKAYRQHCGRADAVANGSWHGWSRDHEWTVRSLAYDAHCEQSEREEYEAELRRVARGRGRIDSTAQELFEETLEFARKILAHYRTLPPDEIPTDELARLGRLLAIANRSSGTGNSAKSDAEPTQTIVREYVGVDVDGV